MNRLLASLSAKDEFVSQCMDLNGPARGAAYWPRMRQLNTEGPPLLGVLANPPPLDLDAFERARRDGAMVLDCRSPEAFAAHIPGAINVGIGVELRHLGRQCAAAGAGPGARAGSRPTTSGRSAGSYLRIGYPLPRGWLAGGMLTWRTAGKPIDVLPQWTVRDLRRELHEQSDLLLLDVRQPAEWQADIPGALHLTGAELTRRVDDLLASIQAQRPIAVICGSGYRSSVAASVLKARGHQQVAHVLGGMTGWQAEDFETTNASDEREAP